MTRLHHQVVRPANEAIGPSAMIIMPNELMAGIDDFHTARAQHVADVTGLPVLAYERLKSASRSVISLATRRYVTREHVAIHAETATELDKVLKREDAHKAYVVGHSGGATEGIGIIVAEQLPVVQGVFTEPGGMRNILPIKAELIDYGLDTMIAQWLHPSRYLDGKAGNQPPKEPPAASEMAHRLVAEACTYGGFLRREITKESLTYILEKMPNVAVDVIFTEHTPVDSAKRLRRLRDEWNGRRPNFNARVMEGQYHFYFDNYTRFANAVADAMDVAKARDEAELDLAATSGGPKHQLDGNTEGESPRE